MAFYHGTVLIWFCSCGSTWQKVEPTVLICDSYSTECPICGKTVWVDGRKDDKGKSKKEDGS